MKKFVLLLAASMTAAPAFAASTLAVTRTNPLGSVTTLRSLSALPSLDTASDSGALPKYSQAYALQLPGSGKGGTSSALTRSLPELGTLSLTSSNQGAGGHYTYTESITNE